MERIRDTSERYAPQLVDVEVVHTLRRLVVTGVITEDRATDTLRDLRDLPLIRVPHDALVERMWGLRHNLSAYDAAFVALAEALDVPLITCDGRMARSAGHRARIELFAP